MHLEIHERENANERTKALTSGNRYKHTHIYIYILINNYIYFHTDELTLLAFFRTYKEISEFDTKHPGEEVAVTHVNDLIIFRTSDKEYPIGINTILSSRLRA